MANGRLKSWNDGVVVAEERPETTSTITYGVCIHGSKVYLSKERPIIHERI